MKKTLVACLTAPLMLVLAAEASAQRPGGDRSGGDIFDAFRRNTIYWFPNIDRVVKKTDTSDDAKPEEADPATDETDGGEDDKDQPDWRPRGRDWLNRNNTKASAKKYIFIYVRHPLEEKEPTAFQSKDLIDASYKEWAFVKMDLDSENAWQKQWKLTKAPFIVGCDIYGNEFQKFPGASSNPMRGLVKNLPRLIYTFQTRLKADFARATKEIEANRERGLEKFVNLALLDKMGYKEIEGSLEVLATEGGKDFEKGELAETGDVGKAIEFYEKMSSIYKTTPVGLQAGTRIARLEHGTGKIRSAILRLQKILKLQGVHLEDALKDAGKVLEKIVAEGNAKIDATAGVDAAEARTRLRQIMKDYDDTEVAKRAQEELRHLK